ncbi:MAG: hypothetical protein KIPDCIKN_03022 [Haliscomenobacter sp.]|nr:hypothetical protein [Haliscomenobacter sp.]
MAVFGTAMTAGIPKQNKGYWDKKRMRNAVRDAEVNLALSAKGWKVIRLWECDIKKGNLKEALITLYSH